MTIQRLASIGCIMLVSALGTHQTKAKPATITTPKTVFVSPWSWTTEKWTKDDAPYRKIRAELMAAIKSKKLTSVQLQKYKAAAQKKPSDAPAQFRRGYAAYYLALRTPDSRGKETLLKGVAAALANAPSPHTYEYARLRFLLEARDYPDSQLKTLGQRLLRRNPKDSYVKYYLVNLLDPSTSVSEKKQALKYTQELIRRNPKNSSAYSTLGSIYYRSWLATHNQNDADQAIAAYQKYLQFAAAKAEFRQQAQGIIKEIEIFQPRFNAQQRKR